MGSTSPKIGGTGGETGTPYSFSCPGSSYISQISGRSGDWNDGLSVTCSDGTQSPFWGGQGGNPYTESSPGGFTGWGGMRGGYYVDAIQLLHSDGTMGPAHGGMGGGAASAWSCPPGQGIYQVSGNAGQYLDSVQFGCRTLSQPAIIPSLPSSAPIVPGQTPTIAATNPSMPTYTSQPVQSGSSSMMWVLLLVFIFFASRAVEMSNSAHRLKHIAANIRMVIRKVVNTLG